MAASADQLPDLITIVAVWHNIDCWKNSISLVNRYSANMSSVDSNPMLRICLP